MKETIVARRYARAFVDTYSDPVVLETLSGDLSSLAELFGESRELASVMGNPSISSNVKSGIIEDLLKKNKASKETAKAVKVILDNGRITELPIIAEECKRLSFEALGKVRVDVVSAMKLTKKDVEEISDRLSRITGKTAVVDVSVDPGLLGGIVVKVGSKVYDGSVKNQLMSLKVGL